MQLLAGAFSFLSNSFPDKSDRRNEGLFDVLEERKEPALTMAKELWQEASPQGLLHAATM